jgi:YidC/Oxa1 family membrane protein insertase
MKNHSDHASKTKRQKKHAHHLSLSLFFTAARTLLVPLSVQQSKSSEYMKFLKPYMSEIKTKFKDNKDMQNRAMGKLLEDAKQNPLSGCLFSLAQLPLLLGLYRGVRSLAVDGQLDEPFLWIPSLAGPVSPPDYRGMEWLTEGWTDGVPSLGWETTLAFLIMPVALVVAQSVTMSVLTPAMDDTSMSDDEKEQFEKTQRFLKFLPLMIGFFSLQVPAGLTIYWMTSNLYTLTQSLTVRAYYAANPPKIELPDYWDSLDNIEAMSLEDKKAAAQAGLAVGPSFQSLKDGTCNATTAKVKRIRM